MRPQTRVASQYFGCVRVSETARCCNLQKVMLCRLSDRFANRQATCGRLQPAVPPPRASPSDADRRAFRASGLLDLFDRRFRHEELRQRSRVGLRDQFLPQPVRARDLAVRARARRQMARGVQAAAAVADARPRAAVYGGHAVLYGRHHGDSVRRDLLARLPRPVVPDAALGAGAEGARGPDPLAAGRAELHRRADCGPPGLSPARPGPPRRHLLRAVRSVGQCDPAGHFHRREADQHHRDERRLPGAAGRRTDAGRLRRADLVRPAALRGHRAPLRNGATAAHPRHEANAGQPHRTHAVCADHLGRRPRGAVLHGGAGSHRLWRPRAHRRRRYRDDLFGRRTGADFGTLGRVPRAPRRARDQPRRRPGTLAEGLHRQRRRGNLVNRFTKGEQVSIKVYLAGPEVFLRNAREQLDRKIELTKAAGLIPVSPGDFVIPPQPSKRQFGHAVSEIDEKMMDTADAIIANLTPYHGVSADVGTCYELGYMCAQGKLAYAYTNVAADMRTRTVAHYGGDVVTDATGRWRGGRDGLAVGDVARAET